MKKGHTKSLGRIGKMRQNRLLRKAGWLPDTKNAGIMKTFVRLRQSFWRMLEGMATKRLTKSQEDTTEGPLGEAKEMPFSTPKASWLPYSESIWHLISGAKDPFTGKDSPSGGFYAQNRDGYTIWTKEEIENIYKNT